jgi:hypothetical protein
LRESANVEAPPIRLDLLAERGLVDRVMQARPELIRGQELDPHDLLFLALNDKRHVPANDVWTTWLAQPVKIDNRRLHAFAERRTSLAAGL